jgi:ribosomal protein S1
MEIQEQKIDMHEEKMENGAYEKTFVSFNPGEVIKGKVVQIGTDQILVDIGGKTEGVIPQEEFGFRSGSNLKEQIRVGDVIDVFVVKIGDEDGGLVLSRKRAELEKSWLRIREAKEKGKIINGLVIEKVKGGLVVDLGVRGFIPVSHVGRGRLSAKNLDDYIGETLPLKVLDMDDQKRRVVLSHREAAEEQRKSRRDTFWKQIYPGEFRKGPIVRIVPFGAFVDLGGVDGLIHLSELSWRRVKNPSDVLKIGEQVEVVVLGFEPEKERISLSLRRALPDPWTQLPQEYQIGGVVEGTISRIAKKYVFVEVMPGVEGLIPLSELSHERVSEPESVVKEGEQVKVKILDIQPELRKMLLSKKEAVEDYGHYLNSQEDRPLTVKDILGDKLESMTKAQVSDSQNA